MTSPAATGSQYTLNSVQLVASAKFYGNDFSLVYDSANQDYYGYGLKMIGGTGADKYDAELSKLTIPASVVTELEGSTSWGSLSLPNPAITVTNVTDITFPPTYQPPTSDAFGSTYSDSSGDAFFLANSEQVLYEASASQLASGSTFQLTYEASASLGSNSSFDGADCQFSSSPFDPPTPENDTYTVVAGGTLTVSASQGPSLLSNDQILTGATVTMGTTTLEPSGADVTTTFGSGKTSGTLAGANGTLDVTDAANGYFTFTPVTGFNGAETFTYNLVETYPSNKTSTLSASVTIDVVQQQVVTWSTPAALSTSDLYAATNAATDLGGAPITYLLDTGQPNTAGCSVTPVTHVITYVGAGTCRIIATAAATTTYSAASTELTFTVEPGTIPTLSWSPTPTTLWQSGTTVTGDPVTDSDGQISYAIAGSGNTAGCSLASTSPLVLDFATAPGQCSITVSTSQTATYAPDSVSVSFTVLATPSFSWAPSPTSFTLSQSPQTVASATTNSDGVISYAVSSTGNSAGCSLASASAPVRLSFTSNGVCTVSASLAASTSYIGAGPISEQFTIGLIPQAITFSAPASGTVGGSATLTATGGGSGHPVTFSVDASSGAGVCNVTGTNGATVNYTAVGSCVIDANQAGNASYADAPQAQQPINVVSEPAPSPLSTTTTTSTTNTTTPPSTSPAPPVAVTLSVPPGTGPLQGGSSVPVTITPAIGDAPASSPPTFTVTLPPGETFGPRASNPNWFCSLSDVAATLTCTWSGQLPLAAGAGLGSVEAVVNLAPSASGTVTITVTSPGDRTTTVPLTVHGLGYRLMATDNGVFDFGSARFKGSCPVSKKTCHKLNAQGVGIATSPDGKGYWLVAADGGVFTFGSARYYGSCPHKGKPCGDLKAPVVAVAATPDGHGYWLASANGAVFAFGDAHNFSSCTSTTSHCGVLKARIVAVAATPDGHGYWLASANGAVFAFGDAGKFGSGVSTERNGPSLVGTIVGIAPTPDGHGYWLASSGGDVFAFGSARFHGNIVTAKIAKNLVGHVVGIAATPDGRGYWLAGTDGGVFAFGDARFLGNIYTAHIHNLVGPVMGVSPAA